MKFVSIFVFTKLSMFQDEFVEYYNNERIKAKNDYQSPNEKREKYYRKQIA